MRAKLTVLIVGGYGTFGGRIVELIEHDPRLRVLVAGRSIDKARAYCASRGGVKAKLTPAEFDRDGDFGAQLTALRPDILIDASGPFQDYGEARYRVVEACIERRVHYIDLADGSDFVVGVSALNAAALAAGVYALSGASTFPVLTAAAIRRLSSGLQRIDSIKGGIAPSPYAGVGANVIRAIAGYAGRPIALKRNGQSAIGYPFTEQMRFTIAPPGCVPLRSTMFSLVDVPDLKMLVHLWPGARTIWMGAGPVPAALHRSLIALAWLVRLRLLPSASPFAPLMHFAANHFSWGEHRGGMFVEVQGMNPAGASVTRCWHLLAEQDDGPLIPSMAAAAIIRNTLDGKPPVAGARACTDDLELEDYQPLLAGRKIATGIREEPALVAPLYQRLLGASWESLPEPIRAMHDVTEECVAEGRADVDRGSGIVARVIGAIMGFPKAGRDLPVTVRFTPRNGTEIWTRTFAGKSFSSAQFEGRGRWARLVCERFGPITFAIALASEGDRLRLVLRGWSVFGIPLPMRLCPRSTAYEFVQGGRFCFHVEISLPWIGLIVRYQGWLMPR